VTLRTYNSLFKWVPQCRTNPLPKKETIMKRTTKAVVGIAAALTLGVAATAFAHPGMMGSGMGPAMKGGAMGPAMKGGMGPGAAMRGGFAGPMAGQQLMTAEERAAQFEKMQAAKTTDERQKLMESTRAEMEKRAKDKGVTLPDPAHRH
jgi:hypothetical protein